MTAYYIVFGVVLCGLFLALVRDDQVRRPFLWTYLAFVVLLLVLFAGLRSPHIDADYSSYNDWFSEIHSGPADAPGSLKDPTFAGIAFAVATAGLTYFPIPMFYAFLALAAKTVLAYSVATERAVAIFFFLIFCRFFVLQEMTQIRVAVAIPLMTLAVYLACTRRPAKAILLYMLALAFHLSVAIGIPLFILILCGVRFQSRNWVLLFAPLAVGVSLLLDPLLQMLLNVYRIAAYVRGQEAEYDLSFISVHLFMHLGVILIAVVFFWKQLSLFERVAIVYSAFATFVYSVFITETVIATRLEQIFDLFWLFLFVIVFKRLSPRWHFIYVAAIGMLGFGLFQSTIGIVKLYALWDAPL